MTIVAQISDTHLKASDIEVEDTFTRSECLQRCIHDINNLSPKPDVVIHTGDMTQNARRDEYILAREILNGLDMPLFITPGNRDSRVELRYVFGDLGYFPEDCDYLHYAVEVGGIRLISIDSVIEGSRLGNFCEPQLKSTDAILGEAPGLPTALFMHHPPFDVLNSSHPFQFANRTSVKKLVEIVKRHSQIVRIFCGHAHRCYVGEFAKICASTLPSVAVDLRLGDYPENMKNDPVYQVHRYQLGVGFSSETRLVS